MNWELGITRFEDYQDDQAKIQNLKSKIHHPALLSK
jgi:hypothetical protein